MRRAAIPNSRRLSTARGKSEKLSLVDGVVRVYWSVLSLSQFSWMKFPRALVSRAESRSRSVPADQISTRDAKLQYTRRGDEHPCAPHACELRRGTCGIDARDRERHTAERRPQRTQPTTRAARDHTRRRETLERDTRLTCRRARGAGKNAGPAHTTLAIGTTRDAARLFTRVDTRDTGTRGRDAPRGHARGRRYMYSLSSLGAGSIERGIHSRTSSLRTASRHSLAPRTARAWALPSRSRSDLPSGSAPAQSS